MIVSRHHKKLALRTRVVRKITEIPPEDWNRVYPDVLESYNFFKTLDESNLEQFSLYYLMVYDRKTPVGATACFFMNYSLDTSISGPIRRLTNSIKKRMPNLFSLKVFVCGMPIGQGQIGLSGEKGTIIGVIMRRIEQIAKKKKAAIIAFKDFDGSYTGILDPLQKRSFSKLDGLPTTALNVWFRDFEEYLKTLSYANRYDLRRKFKKVDNKISIDMRITDNLEEDVLGEVHRLYLSIVNKHDMGFELLPAEFFRNISDNMPGSVKYFLWRIDGKLAAFLLCLVSKDTLIDYYIGLDYSVAHKYHLYFLKFRDVLNWCIKNGIKRYEMGITGYEPKRRLGFDFIPLYLYVKMRNRMMRPIFNLICQLLKFEHFDPALRRAKKINLFKGSA